MIVQCSKCSVKFRLDESQLPASGARLRCSRCGNLFAAPVTPRPGRLPRKHSPEAENLALPFVEGEGEGTESPGESGPGPVAGNGAEDKARPAPGFASAPEDEGFCIEAEPENYTIVSEEDPDPSPGRPIKPGKSTRPVYPHLSQRDRTESGKVRVVLLFLALCSATYGVLATALVVDPALGGRVIGGLPLVGETLMNERQRPEWMEISDLRGTPERIRDGGQVFVVSGVASNAGTAPLQNVKVRAQLLDNAGQSVAERSVYCGNVLSSRVLRDLTQRELGILQQVTPPRNFQIEPAGSASFVIVFPDVPPSAVEFSVEVIDARRQT